MSANVLGVILVLIGACLVIFRRRLDKFTNDVERDVFEGRGNPLAPMTPSTLVAGIGFVVIGLLIWLM